MVLQPQEPTISINGTSNLARDYEDFRQGVRVFTDVHVTVGAVSGNKHTHGMSLNYSSTIILNLATIFNSFIISSVIKQVMLAMLRRN